MMAQVLRKIPPINKMMINWQKQAPEDRLPEDGMDAMTQYGLRSQEKPMSLRIYKITDNLELLQAVTMLREDDGRSQGDRRD